MTSRGRGYNSSNDWDTMRDTSAYDSQYPDEDSSASIQYDNTRLYITNLPKGLNEQGLKEAFSRFGTLEEAHMSKDPKKRYALVKYETAGEARVAMMKMNNTEPLGLIISIARKNTKINRPAMGASKRPSMNGFNERSTRDDNESVISTRSRNMRPLDEPTNGDEAKEKMDDDEGLEIDRNLHVELETLKLEELKIKNEQLKIKEQELACKHRILLLQQNETKRMVPNQNSGSNRCVLPDGRILVRNSEKHYGTNRSVRFQDNDAGFTAGAGDSLNIPGLQRATVRFCIVCGASAEFFCSRCGVVFYCSESCQRRDWADRHKDVCHNLQRLSGFVPNKTTEIESVVPPAAPLRLPNARRDQDDSGSDRAKPKYQHGERNQRSPRINNNNNKPYNNNNRSNRTYTPNKDMRRPQINKDDNNDECDNAANPKPTPETPVAIKQEPSKTEPIKPQNIKPEGVDPQAIKPAQPMRSVQHRLTSMAVKENVTAVVAPVQLIKEFKPAYYVIEKLAMGDTFLVSIEATTAECASKQTGFVCLSLHGDFEDSYSKLCQDYTVQCENNNETIIPSPNILVSYLSPSDGGWYRARCLTSTKAALLDAAKVASIEGTTCKAVSKEYSDIPEFCAVINGAGLKVGMNLQCTLKSKTANGFKVSMLDAETCTDLGEAEVERWIPEVEMPAQAPTTPSAPALPTIPRPDLQNSTNVVLLDAKTLSRACIRSATPETTVKFDSILHDVLLYALKAQPSPLKEPPQKGSVVISEFTDGVQYRALVKRTNVKANKYLVEYIEYGNEEIVPLEKLYFCPVHLDLSTVPTVASIVQLSNKPDALTPPALALVDDLKDNNKELILTLPSGDKTAPSGSLVQLHLAKNRENITKKLEEMCTPEWQKIEQRGGDVLETTSIMYYDFQYVKMPTDRSFLLDVVDFSTLRNGYICGYVQGEPLAEIIYGELTDKISKYATSDLCKEPYLPKLEELCVTKCPPYEQWFRAVLTEQVNGAGGKEASVLYVDYGNVQSIPVSFLRKMLPEFVDGYPGLANLCEIKDFPKDITDAQLHRALELLNVNEEGHGTLAVKRCTVIDRTIYQIEVPELIDVLKAV